MDGAPVEHVERLLERLADSPRPSRCSATWTSCSPRPGARRRDGRERAGVLVHLEAAGAPGERSSRNGSCEALARARGSRFIGTERQASSAGRSFRPGRCRHPRRPVSHGHDRRHAAGERDLDELRRDQVDVRVDDTRCDDQALAGTMPVAVRRSDSHAVQGVRVPGPAESGDPSVLDADRRLADALDRVDHQHVGDHDIEGLVTAYAAVARRPSRIVLPKPIRDSLPGAVSSDSTSASRFVSPRRTRSPVVGP